MFVRSGRRNRHSGHTLSASTERSTAGKAGTPAAARARRAMFDALEDRRLFAFTTVLTNGTGPGAVSIGVDPYGAFGSVTTGLSAQYANFTVGGDGVISRSYVYFSPTQQYLTFTSGTATSPDGSQVGEISFIEFDTTSPTSATSSFNLQGTDPASGLPYNYDITLVQSLSSPSSTPLRRYSTVPDQFQTVLTQTYSFTNLLDASATFSTVRYLEPTDSGTLGTPNQQPQEVSLTSNLGLLDGGRTLVGASDPASVSELSQADLATAVQRSGVGAAVVLTDRRDYVQLQSFGGTLAAAAVRPSGLDAQIRAANGISPALAGIETSPANGIVSTATFSPAFAQQNNFTLAPRETVTYTTLTTFAQGAPIQLLNAVPGVIPATVTGDFAFTGTTENYTFASINGVVQPQTLTIVRNTGTAGAVDVSVVATGGLVPAGSFTISPAVVSFADGQSSATVSVSFDPALVGLDPTTLQLGLTPSVTTSAATTPSTTTINIFPTTPAFSLTSVPTTATAGQGSLVFTITRTGNLAGAASVLFATTGGTAVAGTDYTAVSTRVDFADNETTKTVSVPILAGTQDNNSKTLTITITGSTPDGAATGTTSVIVGTPTATVTLAAPDTTGPTVTGLTTQSTGRGITAVQLTFSEALRGIGGLSSFSLASRSGEGAFGAARSRNVQIISATYNAATNTVVLIPRRPLSINTNYAVTVRPNAGLTDLAGNTLNRLPASPTTGVPYTAYFARATKITYADRSGDRVTLQIRNGSFDLVRNSDGEAATVTLFGLGQDLSTFSGSIRRVRNNPGATTINTIRNPDLASISLAPNIAVASPSINNTASAANVNGIRLVVSDEIVRYTYIGDTNLDGILDGIDVDSFIAHVGDRNLDGQVTQEDLDIFFNLLNG